MALPMGFLWVSYKIPIGSYKEPNKPSDSLAWFDAGSPNPPCAPPSWPGPSSASGCPGPPPLRSSGRFVRCTASAGSSRSSVANSLPRSVVTTKFPSSPVSRLGVLVLQRFHGGLPGEDVHHHQAVLRLPPRVLAEVDEVGLQPVVRPLGCRLAQRARPGRLRLPAHVGLQRLEGHGLRHVEVALPCESVQLPRVPHVEVVGQVPQRLHL